MVARQGGDVVTMVGVHGIAHEQLGPEQVRARWAPALADGLLKAARPDPPPIADFDVAYYGDLFLSQADEGLPVAKGPASLRTLEDVGRLPPEDLAFVEEAAADISVDESAVTKGFKAVPGALLPLTRQVCRQIDGGLVIALIAELVQVRRYLTDEQLAEQIRARVLEYVGEGCPVLVGHSLGSVVAFETIALNPGLQVDTLITAGSPLSMRTVVNKLRAGTPGVDRPGKVRRWVNVYDKYDPVAGAGVVRRVWPEAEDFEVNNGRDDPHSATRYLSKKCTGRAVLQAVRG